MLHQEVDVQKGNDGRRNSVQRAAADFQRYFCTFWLVYYRFVQNTTLSLIFDDILIMDDDEQSICVSTHSIIYLLIG